MTTDIPVFTRDDAARWAFALMVMGLDFAWLTLSGRSVTQASVMASGAGIVTLIVISATLSVIAARPKVRSTQRGLHYRRLALLSQSGAFMVLLSSTMSVLCYLLVTLAPPLVDERLARLDNELGFQWPQLYSWVREHPSISTVLKAAYASGGLQMVLVPMLAALLGRAEYLREFLSTLTLSCVLLLLLAAPWPAAGAYVYFGMASVDELATISHFSALRDGSLLVFDLEQMQGLVSIPSYHTAMALIFMQGMRWTRIGFVLACVLNLAMIASTPTEGGHYLVDVIAGVALWALTVCLLRALSGLRKPAELVLSGRARPA